MYGKTFFTAIVALGTLIVNAGNLVSNGDFTQYKQQKIADWVKVGNLEVAFSAKDGVKPESGVVEFTASGAKNNGSLRQGVGKKVFPGKKYRLTASFKGENFKAADWGFLLINRNWKGNVGIRRFVVSDGKWITRSKVVTVPAHWTDVTAVVFATDLQGKFFVSNVQCEEVK